MYSIIWMDTIALSIHLLLPSSAIHVNVWQRPLQYCKVISLQLIKINEKIKKFKKSLWVKQLSTSTCSLCVCVCVDIHLQVLWVNQRVRLLDPMVRVRLVFWESTKWSSKWLYPFASSPAVTEDSCGFTFLPALAVASVLEFDHSNRGTEVSQCCSN